MKILWKPVRQTIFYVSFYLVKVAGCDVIFFEADVLVKSIGVSYLLVKGERRLYWIYCKCYN